MTLSFEILNSNAIKSGSKAGQITRILIEHLGVPDFCYTKFEYVIAHDQTNWYKQYKKYSDILEIVK